MSEYIHKCKYRECQQLFRTKVEIIEYCSNECAEKETKAKKLEAKQKINEEKFKDIEDILECKICGFKSTILHYHIRHNHGMTAKQYMRKFKVGKEAIYHSSYTEKAREYRTNTPIAKKGPLKPVLGIKRCKQCNRKMKDKKMNKVFCSTKCRDKWNYNKKKTPSPELKVKCKNCEEIFITNRSRQKFCCIKCKDVYRKRVKHKKIFETERKDIADILVCKECGVKTYNLTTHLRVHKITKDEYCKKYNIDKKDLIHHSIKTRNKISRDKLIEELQGTDFTI